MSFVIRDWQSGKKTRRGAPLPAGVMAPMEEVLVVEAHEIHDYMGTRGDEIALREHLRKLRDEGKLVAPTKGRLQSQVRMTGDRGHIRAYVFRGGNPPRFRRRRRVYNW
jgi:hypothetical protein